MNRHERISAECARKLARAAEGTANGLGASLQDYWLDNPTRPCACDHGANIEEDGQLRTCVVCMGLGYLMMTLAEIREEYRAIRARVCAANAITETSFDDEARQPGLASPGRWLVAAKKIERKRLAAREERKQATRSRW